MRNKNIGKQAKIEALRAKPLPPHRPRKELKTDIELNDMYYTVYEASEILKVNHQTVRRAIKRGEIKVKKIGPKILIPKSEIML